MSEEIKDSQHEEENNELTSEDLQSDQKSAPNPFPGLRPFKIDESHLFFGREGQSDEVLLKLSKNRFVGVIGPSGSGKSSFVYCGVLPILYGGFLTGISADWEVMVTRPGGGPIDNLAESLLWTDPEYHSAEPEEKKLKKTIISSLLRSSSLGLVEAIQQIKKDTQKNFLVLVDQFEELFRFKDSRDEGSVDETLAFINLLLEAVDNEDCPVYVALTMRSDFIGECAQFADLTKKINDSHYLIPQMTREQKKRAIEGPVAVGKAEITSRLTQRLLNDLGDNPDQLPILQHSLMRTWNYWSKYRDFGDEPLDIKHYEAIGTMSEALSLHANEAYDELDEKQKRICEFLFKAITEKRGENFGIRRPTRLDEIAAISNSSVEEVASVIEKFREPGRSLLIPAYGVALTGKSIIDISHESLMRIWVRLKNWVDDEADAVQMYMRLAEGATMYQMGKSGLWRPPDLQLGLNWEAKHKPTLIWAQRYHPAFERTMEFLSHSKREYETEQRIKELQAKRRLKTARVTAIVMAGLCVVAIGFLLYAFEQQALAYENATEALENEAKANRNAEIAKLNADTAKIMADSASRAAKAANMAREEATLSALAAKDSAEEAKRARLLAQENYLKALESQKDANIQREAAEYQKNQAFEALQKAQEEERKAIRANYLASAKATALRSIDMTSQQFFDQKGLLAQQAYLFNKNFEGYKYESDIYNGLYFALKYYDSDLTKTVENVFDNTGAIFLRTAHSKNVIYSVHENGKIIGWRSDGLRRSQTTVREKEEGFTVKGISISDDDQFMALGGRNIDDKGAIQIIDLNNTSSISNVSGLGAGVIDLTYASNGVVYALDDFGKSIMRVNGSQATLVKTSPYKLTSISISSDSRYIYTATTDGKLLRWDSQNSFDMQIMYDGDFRITSVEISPINNMIAFGDEEGQIYIMIGTTRLTVPSHKSMINAISFSLNGEFMATSSNDQTVRIWNLNDLSKEPVVLNDHEDRVSSIAFTTDNNQIVAGTAIRSIKFWPIQIDVMGNQICNFVNRNLTEQEWQRYIPDIENYEVTCPNLLSTNSGEDE